MTEKRPYDDQWQVTNNRELFSNRIVNFVSSNVTNPRNGVTKEFYRFEFPGWVNIVAVTGENEIVLVRQYRFGTGQMETEIPGGSVEQGEDPLEAGLRELLEETGFKGDNGRIIGKVCPNPAIQDNYCYTVLVENVRPVAAPHLDPMEQIEVFTAPQDQVLKMIEDGSIDHGLVLNGLLFYFMLGTGGKRLSPRSS